MCASLCSHIVWYHFSLLNYSHFLCAHTLEQFTIAREESDSESTSSELTPPIEDMVDSDHFTHVGYDLSAVSNAPRSYPLISMCIPKLCLRVCKCYQLKSLAVEPTQNQSLYMWWSVLHEKPSNLLFLHDIKVPCMTCQNTNFPNAFLWDSVCYYFTAWFPENEWTHIHSRCHWCERCRWHCKFSTNKTNYPIPQYISHRMLFWWCFK